MIKIFKGNEKLDESYQVLCEKLNAICEQYQLECDLIKQDIAEDEKEQV